MIVLLWNCHGIGHSSTVRSLRNYAVSHRLDVVFLSEVKIMHVDRIEKIVKILGFASFEFVPAQGRAGGLLLAWNSSMNIQIILANESVINCLICNTSEECPWQFTSIYGPVVPILRPQFWDYLTEISAAYQGPWVVGGDFNVALTSVDKLGGRPVALSSTGRFRQMLDETGLIGSGVCWTGVHLE